MKTIREAMDVVVAGGVHVGKHFFIKNGPVPVLV